MLAIDSPCLLKTCRDPSLGREGRGREKAIDGTDAETFGRPKNAKPVNRTLRNEEVSRPRPTKVFTDLTGMVWSN